ncbi:MAG: hypothetical protein ABI743_14905, partial [bacterium]
NSTLTDGHFYLEGQITAESGLDEVSPLTLFVTDTDTGLTTELNILEVVTGWTTETIPLDGDTSLDIGTGTFIIDGNADMVVDAGNKALRLVAKDSLGRTDTWSVAVESEGFGSPTLAELGTSRAAYLQRLRDAVSDYRDYVGGIPFDSPFYYVQLDLDYADLFLGYLDSRIADPTSANAGAIGHDFEGAVVSLIAGAGSPPTNAEGTYREGMENAAGWERVRADSNQTEAADAQLGLHPSIEGILALRTLEKAFYDHTFVDTDIVAGTAFTLSNFNFSIYQDTGTPLPGYSFLWNWDPGDVESETADPGSPGCFLSVRFVGPLPQSGHPHHVNEIDQDGYSVIPDNGSADDPGQQSFDDVASHGHIVAPLGNLWQSPYVYFGSATMGID